VHRNANCRRWILLLIDSDVVLPYSNMDKLQIAKLKGKSNWSIWRLQIESNLQYDDFEGVLTGKITEFGLLPNDATSQPKKDYEASHKSYKKANGYAVTLLGASVEEEPCS
jgi:hypothetical protein